MPSAALIRHHHRFIPCPLAMVCLVACVLGPISLPSQADVMIGYTNQQEFPGMEAVTNPPSHLILTCNEPSPYQCILKVTEDRGGAMRILINSDYSGQFEVADPETRQITTVPFSNVALADVVSGASPTWRFGGDALDQSSDFLQLLIRLHAYQARHTDEYQALSAAEKAEFEAAYRAAIETLDVKTAAVTPTGSQRSQTVYIWGDKATAEYSALLGGGVKKDLASNYRYEVNTEEYDFNFTYEINFMPPMPDSAKSKVSLLAQAMMKEMKIFMNVSGKTWVATDELNPELDISFGFYSAQLGMFYGLLATALEGYHESILSNMSVGGETVTPDLMKRDLVAGMVRGMAAIAGKGLPLSTLTQVSMTAGMPMKLPSSSSWSRVTLIMDLGTQGLPNDEMLAMPKGWERVSVAELVGQKYR